MATEIINNSLFRVNLTTKASTQLHTHHSPIDTTLSVAGTAQNLWTPDTTLPTINICTNPSAETGTPPTGFTASGATLARSNTIADFATYSLRITPDNAAAGEGAYWTIGTIAGQSEKDKQVPIAISAYFNKNAVAGAEDARVRLWGSTSGFVANGNTLTLDATWQRSSLSYNIQTNETWRAYLVNVTQAATLFYVDGIQIELQPTVTTYCLAPETLVAADGYVKKLSDIEIGECLLGADGSARYITSKWPVETEAFEIELETGMKIIASGDHKFLAEKYADKGARGVGWNFKWDWCTTKDLRVGKHVKLSNQVCLTTNNIKNDKKLKEAYLLGYLLGDGYFSQQKRDKAVAWTFGAKELDIAKTVEKMYAAVYTPNKYHAKLEDGFPKVYAVKDNELCLHSSSNSTYTAVLEKGFVPNTEAPNKLLPNCVWTYDKDELLSFISGLIDSDGTIDKNYNIAIMSASKELIVELQKLMSCAFGVHGWLQKEENTKTNFSENRNMYRVRFTKADSKYLYDIGLRLFNKKKADRQNELLNKSFINNRRGFSKIKAIIPLGIKKLYDITLLNDHDFIANGIITHNCDGTQGRLTRWDGTAHASVSRRKWGMKEVRGYTFHTTNDVYVDFDTTATTSSFFKKAGADWWNDYPISVVRNISFLNAVTGERPRIWGEVHGVDFASSEF